MATVHKFNGDKLSAASLGQHVTQTASWDTVTTLKFVKGRCDFVLVSQWLIWLLKAVSPMEMACLLLTGLHARSNDSVISLLSSLPRVAGTSIGMSG